MEVTSVGRFRCVSQGGAISVNYTARIARMIEFKGHRFEQEIILNITPIT